MNLCKYGTDTKPELLGWQGCATSAQSRRRSTAVLRLLFLLLAGASANKPVLFDYVPREVDADDRLTLKAGDVAAITHEHSDGVVGRFPNNYVEKQRFGDGGGGGVLTGGSGSDTDYHDHAPGSDDPASPHPRSQCHRVDAGHDGADGTPCAARGSNVGRPPLVDAGVPVPAYASAPRSNTFQTTVLEDFVGADPAARLVLLAELRASLHLFSEARLPGLFARNCSEMTAPLLAEVRLIPQVSRSFDRRAVRLQHHLQPSLLLLRSLCIRFGRVVAVPGEPGSPTVSVTRSLPRPNCQRHKLDPQFANPKKRGKPPTHQGGPAFAPRAGRAGSAGDA